MNCHIGKYQKYIEEIPKSFVNNYKKINIEYIKFFQNVEIDK